MNIVIKNCGDLDGRIISMPRINLNCRNLFTGSLLLAAFGLLSASSIAQSKSVMNCEILCGLGFGENTKISPTRQEALEPYGFGVGGRLGYTFEEGYYLGATVVFHKGEGHNWEYIYGGQTYPLRLETRIWYAGAEFGCSISTKGQYTIRPFFNFGIAKEGRKFLG